VALVRSFARIGAASSRMSGMMTSVCRTGEDEWMRMVGATAGSSTVMAGIGVPDGAGPQPKPDWDGNNIVYPSGATTPAQGGAGTSDADARGSVM
jgi:hypothetical protein